MSYYYITITSFGVGSSNRYASEEACLAGLVAELEQGDPDSFDDLLIFEVGADGSSNCYSVDPEFLFQEEQGRE